MPRPTLSRRPRNERGAMLLEALIAILIFSLGILGIVGLQANAVKQSTDARFRIEAAVLADELMGQMWTDDRSSIANMQAKFNTCSTTSCTGYNTWAAKVQGKLPGVDLSGTTKPTVTIDPAGIIQIVIKWRQPGEDATSDEHKFAMEAQIRP